MPNENDNKLVNLADLKTAFNEIDNRKKNIQTVVSDPTASGTAVSFIDSISQNAQGVISATKKTVPTVSTTAAGLMSAADKVKLDATLDLILTPAQTITIPASGNSASYSMTGLTSGHELVRWNFSASAENAPPVGLTWTTYNGYFTIINNGGSTSESIRPVFALPSAIAITAR